MERCVFNVVSRCTSAIYSGFQFRVGCAQYKQIRDLGRVLGPVTERPRVDSQPGARYRLIMICIARFGDFGASFDLHRWDLGLATLHLPV
jgi:hypothetical protein